MLPYTDATFTGVRTVLIMYVLKSVMLTYLNVVQGWISRPMSAHTANITKDASISVHITPLTELRLSTKSSCPLPDQVSGKPEKNWTK